MDPLLPRVGASTHEEAANIIWSIFPENCMKIKKFWPWGAWGGGGRSSHFYSPLISAAGTENHTIISDISDRSKIELPLSGLCQLSI